MGCPTLTYQEINPNLKPVYNPLKINKKTCAGSYGFGFNGQEKDDEVKGIGNSYVFEYRIYDTRLGRFSSIDPLSNKYPFYSSYQFAGNKPINSIDMEGLEEFNVILWLAEDGSYGVRVHVVREDGPLKVNYYFRDQAMTRGAVNPTDGSSGGCVDCLPRGLQPTDQLIVSKEVGVSGVTEDNIWASKGIQNTANSAMRVYQSNSQSGAVRHDNSFDGTLTISSTSETKTTSGTRTITSSTTITGGEFASRDPSGSPAITPNSSIPRLFSNASALQSALNSLNSSLASNQSVGTYYVRTNSQRDALNSAQTTLGTSVPVVVDPTKAAGRFNSYFGYDVNQTNTRTVPTISSTTTTKTTTATIGKESYTTKTTTR